MRPLPTSIQTLLMLLAWVATAAFNPAPGCAATPCWQDEDTQAAVDDGTDETAEPDSVAVGPAGQRFGEPVRVVWQSVARITAGNGDVREVLLTLPIPSDWPEQSVRVIEEQVPSEMTGWKVRELKTAPRQMVGILPSLAAGESATISLRFDVEVRQVLPPENPAQFRLPSRVPRDIQTWLDESPGISHRDSRIRNIVKEITADCQFDWERVERLREWIVENIAPDTEERVDTVLTLKDRRGTALNRVRLLVALLRTAKIPARMVWADQVEYAEFWLVDSANRGQWFPVHCTGEFPVGTSPGAVVILQKGDHFRVPEKKQETLEFVFGFVSAKGTSRPRVEFVEGPVVE